jgi:putative ABC transport system permease protein
MMGTTAIYSVVRAVVLDPFPYKDVDNLMSVRVSAVGQLGGRTNYSTDQFLEIAERSTVFDGVIASTISDVLWTNGTEPQRVRGNYGTPNTFQVMGVPPLVGRVFGPDDVQAGSAPVAVLGYRFWQRQFGGDRNVVGRELRLDGTTRTVVGVMPKCFMWRGADVYLPIVFRHGEIVNGVRNVHLLGRLKPNVTDAQAEADLRPIIEELKRREPGLFPDKWRVGLLSFKETFPSSIRQNLWTMLGAVGLLLLIACANVSNLLLSKAAVRRREMTVRATLGAGRAAIVRQLLIESLLIAVAAAVVGTGLAALGLRAILAIVPPNTIPDEAEIALNAPVLIFSIIVAVITSVTFGLAPALSAASHDMTQALREGGRTVTTGRASARWRNSLVVVEVALSLMLLIAAALMIRTYAAVQHIDFGFRTDRVLTMRVPLPPARYADRTRRVEFFRELTERLRVVPGVEEVGLNTSTHPLGNFGAPVEVVGTAGPAQAAFVHQTNAGYARTLGIAVVEGQFLSENDVIRERPVAVVNRAFVLTRLGGRPALGSTLRIPRLRQPPFSATQDTFEIIGVVANTINRGTSDEVQPEIYVPFTFTGLADTLVVLARGDAAALAKPAVAQIYAIDKEQPATDVRTIEDLLQSGGYAGPRFNLVLFSLFAIIGLSLSIVGVYGVMSSAVAQQSQEVGVRIAIGATPGRVFRMVVGHGARLLGLGVLAGLIGSVLAARLLAAYVWHASTFDALTFGAVAALLFGVGLQTCMWPARRASRINPIVAIRQG